MLRLAAGVGFHRSLQGRRALLHRLGRVLRALHRLVQHHLHPLRALLCVLHSRVCVRNPRLQLSDGTGVVLAQLLHRLLVARRAGAQLLARCVDGGLELRLRGGVRGLAFGNALLRGGGSFVVCGLQRGCVCHVRLRQLLRGLALRFGGLRS